MKIIFCKDGILRSFDYGNSKLLSLTYIQELLQMNDSFTFLSRFLTQEVVFEKGLTFNNFFKCLEPWAEFWENYTQNHISNYIKVGRTPRILKKNNYIEEVEFSNFINIQSSLTPIFRDSIVYNSDVLTIANSKHKEELFLSMTQNFTIDNQYCIFGYTQHSPQLAIDIVEVPYYEWMNAQFTLKRSSQVIFNEDGLKDAMDMQETKLTSRNIHNLVFSKNMLNLGGNHMEVNDSFIDSSFSFVEGEAFFTLEQIMRNIFKFIPSSVLEDDTIYSNLIYESVQSVLNGTFKLTSETNTANVIYSLVQSKLVNYYENINTNPKLSENNEEPEPNDKVLVNDFNQNSQNSSVLQFNKNDKNSSFESKPKNSDNIISFNNFKKSDEDNKPIIPIISPELTENSQIFSQMISYAEEDNEELIDSNTIYPNDPHNNRIMGVTCENLMPYLNIEDFHKTLKE